MDRDPQHGSPAESQEYEPPRVEEVLDSSELTREVHYAGQVIVSPGTPG